MRLKPSEIVAAAIIIGFIVVLLGFGLYPSLRKAPREQCLVNLKAVSSSVSLYATDHLARFPLEANWVDAVTTKYVDDLSTFVCPEVRPTREQLAALQRAKGRPLPAGYSLFRPLAGGNAARLTDLERTPVVFDSTEVRPNSAAGLDALAFRHMGRTANIYFADGHGETVTEAPAIPQPLFKSREREGETTQEAPLP